MNFDISVLPGRRRQACFAAKMFHELLGLGQLLPDLGEKCCPGFALFQYYPIRTGAQFGQQIVSLVKLESNRSAQNRNIDPYPFKLLLAERRKSVIVEGGVPGILGD